MSVCLRILLIVGSVLACAYAVHIISKSQMKIENAIFWFGFTFVLLLLSVFPGIAFKLSKIIGIESPANFIYLILIFLCIIKIFSLSIKYSKLENKIATMSQEIAIWKNAIEKENEKDDKI